MLKNRFVLIVLFIVFSVMMSGCQTTNEKVSKGIASELNKRSITLDLREAELDKRELALKVEQENILEGAVNWRSVMCDPKRAHSYILEVQSALKSNGFNPGKVDGFVGKSTMRAVNQFQKKHGLPVDNHINIETLKALGISAVPES
ncbi:MAG: peptidoglycan-binding protein [Thiomicrorhabdus sp.]|nr:peptidoglycan-binding protein [Thiomicrorhabdus sp.]